MPVKLQGQSAIVTGAGRGIGKAVALALAEEGMKVGLLARTGTELRQVAEEIARHGGQAVPHECDLSQPKQVHVAVAALREAFGRIDALVNNAGAFLEASIAETDPEAWDCLLRVNLTGPFLMAREVLPVMIAQGGGRIVNVASTAATKGYLHQGAYCASKHGLLGLSRVLEIEGKPHHVHVSTVCPGGVRTGFARGTYLAQRLEGQTLIEPDDVAGLVVFLLRQPDSVDIPEVVLTRCHVE